MTRILAFLLVSFIATNAVAQDKKDSPEEIRRKADKAVQKLFHDTYPPLFEHIQVTIQNPTHLMIVHDEKAKKDVGSIIEFQVVLKNIGSDEFGFTPDGIRIDVTDSQGMAIPKNRLRRLESGHGDSGTYPIEKGTINYKPIILAINDDNVQIGTKYTIIASYVKIWEKPDVQYDSLSTTKVMEVTAMNRKELNEPAKQPTP